MAKTAVARCYKLRLRYEWHGLHEPEIGVTVVNDIEWQRCAITRANKDGDGVIGVSNDNDVVGVNM